MEWKDEMIERLEQVLAWLRRLDNNLIAGSKNVDSNDQNSMPIDIIQYALSRVLVCLQQLAAPYNDNIKISKANVGNVELISDVQSTDQRLLSRPIQRPQISSSPAHVDPADSIIDPRSCVKYEFATALETTSPTRLRF